ncbi:MAG: EMC3/TMCO1 family protein [Candidatus Thorarchaeota archaeon]
MFFIIAQGANAFVEWITYPPGSMIFILLLATGTALISTGLTKWLVDTDEINRKQVSMKAHQEEKAKIIEIAETDPERYRKLRKRWERKDEMFKQTQQKMGLQRLKPTCITFLPMIIIFGVLRSIYYPGGIPYPVALSPMNANDVPLIGQMLSARTGNNIFPWTLFVYGIELIITIDFGWINFTAWYFLCSFGINTLIQRLLRLQTQAVGSMEQMMGGTRAKALEFPNI